MGAGHCPWAGYIDGNMKALGPMVLLFKGCDIGMDRFIGNVYE